MRIADDHTPCPRKKRFKYFFAGKSGSGRKGMSNDDELNEEMEETLEEEHGEEESEEEESFAGMFEAYSAGMKEDIRVGDRIRGEIISIGKDSVFVDTGTRIDGFVEKQELLDENGEMSWKVGDIVDLYAVAVTGNGDQAFQSCCGNRRHGSPDGRF